MVYTDTPNQFFTLCLGKIKIEMMRKIIILTLLVIPLIGTAQIDLNIAESYIHGDRVTIFQHLKEKGYVKKQILHGILIMVLIQFLYILISKDMI